MNMFMSIIDTKLVFASCKEGWQSEPQKGQRQCRLSIDRKTIALLIAVRWIRLATLLYDMPQKICVDYLHMTQACQ